MQLEAISSHPVTCCLGKETSPHHQLEPNSKMLQCPVSIAEKPCSLKLIHQDYI